MHRVETPGGNLNLILATDACPGSVILTLERLGGEAELARDRHWADALRAMCDEAGVGLRGLFLSTDRAVRASTDDAAAPGKR